MGQMSKSGTPRLKNKPHRVTPDPLVSHPTLAGKLRKQRSRDNRITIQLDQNPLPLSPPLLSPSAPTAANPQPLLFIPPQPFQAPAMTLDIQRKSRKAKEQKTDKELGRRRTHIIVHCSKTSHPSFTRELFPNPPRKFERVTKGRGRKRGRDEEYKR